MTKATRERIASRLLRDARKARVGYERLADAAARIGKRADAIHLIENAEKAEMLEGRARYEFVR